MVMDDRPLRGGETVVTVEVCRCPVQPAPPRAIEPAAEAPRSVQREFRTVVAVAELTVTGMLPAAARPQVEGSVAISGDVQRLSCDEALELVDALLLVVTRIDAVAEERHRVSTTATRDRRGLSDAVPADGTAKGSG